MYERDLTSVLETILGHQVLQIGQVLITKLPKSGYELRHQDDSARNDLSPSTDANDAHNISLLTDQGDYRPLKSAPNLKHGWMLLLKDPSEVRLALDFLYPAALGLWTSQQEHLLRPVSLRETLDRQTGMYALAKQITSEEARCLISQTCNTTQCLKQILWPLEREGTSSAASITQQVAPNTVPLLCHEACGILISAARQAVKTRKPSTSGSQAS